MHDSVTNELLNIIQQLQKAFPPKKPITLNYLSELLRKIPQIEHYLDDKTMATQFVQGDGKATFLVFENANGYKIILHLKAAAMYSKTKKEKEQLFTVEIHVNSI